MASVIASITSTQAAIVILAACLFGGWGVHLRRKREAAWRGPVLDPDDFEDAGQVYDDAIEEEWL